MTRQAIVIWSLLRLTLGFAQIVGSATSVVLLCHFGLQDDLVIDSVVVTTLITMLSVYLFRIRRFDRERSD